MLVGGYHAVVFFLLTQKNTDHRNGNFCMVEVGAWPVPFRFGKGGPIGTGYPERECEVGGRPESKLARGSCLGVVSPGVVAKGNLFSNRGGQPPTDTSSSGKLTPLSFQMLR